MPQAIRDACMIQVKNLYARAANGNGAAVSTE